MTDYAVFERTATIDAGSEKILPLLVDFHRWREWSPWEELDPALERTYSGPESGVGSAYAWSGNRKAGAGHMEVTAVTPQSVDLDVTFTRPFKSRSRSEFRLDRTAAGTTVTWRMLSPKNFMTRVMGLFMNMDKVIGSDLEKGLQQLGRVVGSP